MKRLSLFLLWCVFACGQSTPLPSAEKEVPTPGVGAPRHPLGTIDILSDTQGVDFGPYLRLILPTIRKNWLHVIPVSAETKKGKLAIEFAITGDGRVENLRLVAASGDAVLDRPAWDSITSSNPFPPLPSELPVRSLPCAFVSTTTQINAISQSLKSVFRSHINYRFRLGTRR